MPHHASQPSIVLSVSTKICFDNIVAISWQQLVLQVPFDGLKLFVHSNTIEVLTGFTR